jgi:hypothetical protein
MLPHKAGAIFSFISAWFPVYVRTVQFAIFTAYFHSTMFVRPVLILAIVLSSFACLGQVQLAFFAGPQATTAYYTVREHKQPTEFKYGVMAGAAAKVVFDKQFFFYPSIYYSLKGYKVTLNDPSFPPTELANNNNTTIHTIEIAPLFQIDFNKKPAHPFVRFGPAVDYALAGREKFDTTSSTGSIGTIDRPMLFSFGDYGHFSAQAIIHLGYETGKGLMFFAFYEHGIGSMNNADNGPKILHRIAGVSVGWLFTTYIKERRR